MFIVYLIIIVIPTFLLIFGFFNQIKIYQTKEYGKLTALASSLALNIDRNAHEKMMQDHPWIDDIKTINDLTNKAIFNRVHTIHIENKLNNTLNKWKGNLKRRMIFS